MISKLSRAFITIALGCIVFSILVQPLVLAGQDNKPLAGLSIDLAELLNSKRVFDKNAIKYQEFLINRIASRLGQDFSTFFVEQVKERESFEDYTEEAQRRLFTPRDSSLVSLNAARLMSLNPEIMQRLTDLHQYNIQKWKLRGQRAAWLTFCGILIGLGGYYAIKLSFIFFKAVLKPFFSYIWKGLLGGGAAAGKVASESSGGSSSSSSSSDRKSGGILSSLINFLVKLPWEKVAKEAARNPEGARVLGELTFALGELGVRAGSVAMSSAVSVAGDVLHKMRTSYVPIEDELAKFTPNEIEKGHFTSIFTKELLRNPFFQKFLDSGLEELRRLHPQSVPKWFFFKQSRARKWFVNKIEKELLIPMALQKKREIDEAKGIARVEAVFEDATEEEMKVAKLKIEEEVNFEINRQIEQDGRNLDQQIAEGQKKLNAEIDLRRTIEDEGKQARDNNCNRQLRLGEG